jgi:hypothetical protein
VLKNLRSYYDSLSIGAERFNCRHYADCSRGAEQFTTSKESFVGPEYERGGIPRIAFLSLDSGSADPDPGRKTLEAVRRHELAENVGALHRAKHWYLTHELAYRLLHRFVPGLTVATTSPYFAHVNSAKCCMNKSLRRQADTVLFDNCRSFVPGELEILRPDVIVTQGAPARQVVEAGLRSLSTRRDVIDGVPCEMSLVQCGDKPALWLPTYHPSAYGHFWKQQKACWNAYELAVVRFVQSGDLQAGVSKSATGTAPSPRLVKRTSRRRAPRIEKGTSPEPPSVDKTGQSPPARSGAVVTIASMLDAVRSVKSEASFNSFIAQMRRMLPGARDKHGGILTGQGVQDFQNWQLDSNVQWKLTDGQLLAFMRVEFPLAEGKVFSGSLDDGLKIVAGIRSHYNRDGHHGPSPSSRGMAPSISYGRL